MPGEEAPSIRPEDRLLDYSLWAIVVLFGAIGGFARGRAMQDQTMSKATAAPLIAASSIVATLAFCLTISRLVRVITLLINTAPMAAAPRHAHSVGLWHCWWAMASGAKVRRDGPSERPVLLLLIRGSLRPRVCRRSITPRTNASLSYALSPSHCSHTPSLATCILHARRSRVDIGSLTMCVIRCLQRSRQVFWRVGLSRSTLMPSQSL